MRGKFGKYLLSMGAAVAALAILVPSVSAFEGHTLDIKAHLTVPATKIARLATSQEICYAKKHLGANIPADPNPPGVTTWNNIPVNTCVVWIVTIFVTNPLDYTMKSVNIYDQFNDNVAIALMGASQGTATITQGNCVNLWQVGDLAPGSDACLTLIVWTKCERSDNCDQWWDWNDDAWHWDWDWHPCWYNNSDWCGQWNDFNWTWNSWKDCWQNWDNGGFDSNITGTLGGDCAPSCGCGNDCGTDWHNKCTQEFTCPGTYYLNKSGIVMNWHYYNQDGHLVAGSYTGGPFLCVNVYQPTTPPGPPCGH